MGAYGSHYGSHYEGSGVSEPFIPSITKTASAILCVTDGVKKDLCVNTSIKEDLCV